MPRPKTGSAYPRGNHWYAAVSLDPEREAREGRPKRKRFAFRVLPPNPALPVTQERARLLAFDTQSLYDKGLWSPPTTTKANPSGPVPSLAAYAQRWGQTLSYASAEKTRRILAQWLLPHEISSLSLNEVRPKHVKAWIEWMRAQPLSKGEGTPAPRSIWNVYGALSRLFRDAHLEELVTENPCRLPRGVLPALVDKKPNRPGWRYSRAELVRLATDQEIPPYWRVVWSILFATGVRWGECAALRWSDYDDSLKPLGSLLISRSIQEETHREKETKTGQGRRIPVHPALASVLSAWREEGFARHCRRAPSQSDHIVPKRDGTPMGRLRANQAIHQHCDLLGIPRRALHHTRGTFISQAQDDGADAWLVQKITHSGSGGVFGGYSRLSWETFCREVERLVLWAPSSVPGSATAIATVSG